LVKVYVLIWDTRRVLEEPIAQPGEGCTFGDAGSTIKKGAEVISKENVAILAVDSFIGGAAGLVF
jgi:hypothetical protein